MTATISQTANPVPSAARVDAALTWSEQMILFCAGVAMLVVVSRFVWPLERVPYFEHLPFLLTVPLFVLTLIGRRLSTHRPGSSILGVAWPFVVLATVIILGSGYARFFNGVQESFLNVGLYMTLVPMGAVLVARSTVPMQLVRGFCRVLFIGACAMAIGLIYYFGRREVYHEEIFLIIPLAAFGFLVFRHAISRWGILIFFLGMALLSAKNTSYLVALMTAAYVGLAVWLQETARMPVLLRWWRYYVIFVVLLLTVVAVALLFQHRETYLPSGNVEYRGHTYGLAWQRFLESPIWGTAFAVPSVQKFTLYTVGAARNVLPTHSDIMDLLANGGAIGIGLWALGLLRVARCAYRRLLAPRWLSHPWAPYGHTLGIVSLSAVATYAFNPIMLQPGMSYLMWFSLGLLLGLSSRSDAATQTGRTRHPASDSRVTGASSVPSC